jgi:hypothetical protein
MTAGALGSGSNKRPTAARSLDASELAQAIRRLAVDAQRTLNDPFATIGDLSALSQRINRLIQQTRATPMSNILRWLDSVQRKVQERWSAVDEATVVLDCSTGLD